MNKEMETENYNGCERCPVIYKQLGILETTLSNLVIDLTEIKSDVKSLLSDRNKAIGGLRVLLTIVGAMLGSGIVGAVVTKLILT